MMRNYFDIGEVPDGYSGIDKTSPYGRKTQASVRSSELDSQLKSLDKVLRSKGVNSTDSLFMRMMTLDKSGYDVQELLPYMFLDTLGKAVPKLNLGFGKFSQKRGTERFYNPRKYGVYNRSTGEAF